jgi:subtilase family serine protease
MNLYRDIVQDAKENQCPKRNIRPLNQQTTMANHKSSVNDVINLSKIAKSAILKNFKESKSDFKRVFLIYSRLHNLYKLKHETLFLALELYRKYSLS